MIRNIVDDSNIFWRNAKAKACPTMTMKEFKQWQKEVNGMLDRIKKLYFIKTGEQLPESPKCTDYENRLN